MTDGILECADTSALWPARHVLPAESGVMPPHSRPRANPGMRSTEVRPAEGICVCGPFVNNHGASMGDTDKLALEKLREAAAARKLDVAGGRVRRTSSRFCLGVEHGDYNGTELFGVGTDRFIWMAFKPNGTNRVRLYSDAFPGDGIIEFTPGSVPPPRDPSVEHSWSRFAFGVDHVLRKNGHPTGAGFDAVLHGNIPGGGMSRSASLCLNLILSVFDVNGVGDVDGMRVAELAQAVENEYVGSPCGILDQVMILFAREGMGTHFNPATKAVTHVPLGPAAGDVRLVSLDTGTVRPGLETSTYKIRREECETLVAMCRRAGFPVNALADVKTHDLCQKITAKYARSHPDLVRRLSYIFHAQRRFQDMMAAWKSGDMSRVGAIFRQDGLGLRDDYRISGPELESMCDIVRSVPGVLGERMLGGGDKGAAGAIVRADAVDAVKAAVETGYPRSHPEQQDSFAVHVCRMVQGVTTLEGAI